MERKVQVIEGIAKRVMVRENSKDDLILAMLEATPLSEIEKNYFFMFRASKIIAKKLVNEGR